MLIAEASGCCSSKHKLPFGETSSPKPTGVRDPGALFWSSTSLLTCLSLISSSKVDVPPLSAISSMPSVAIQPSHHMVYLLECDAKTTGDQCALVRGNSNGWRSLVHILVKVALNATGWLLGVVLRLVSESITS